MNPTLELFDVCIIGASISGNYLAFLLSDSNLKILLIEEHSEIGKPLQCAGIVSRKLESLVNLKDHLILNRVNVAKIISPEGNEIYLSGDEQPFIIDRINFDYYFFEQIKRNPNINIVLNEKFKSFNLIEEEEGQLVLVETNKRTIKSKLLVGCDGPLSRVARQCGIINKIIYATQIRTTTSFDPNTAELYFDERWNDLFGWLVPENSKTARIGLATSDGISNKFKAFLKKLDIKKEDIIDRQGGIIPIGMMNECAFDNTLLLGDAACQVKATTGGGIVMLLIAAKFAAGCIKSSFKEENFSKSFIYKNYEKQCLYTIGKQLKFHFLLRIFFQNCTSDDFESLFQLIRKHKLQKLISLYGDMDFPRKMLIRLFFNAQIVRFLIKFVFQHPKFLISLVPNLKSIIL
ncbi:MAG: geranylgeranyl reductase family protein [Candidatus Lokiarchaeota archaeon]|nr:geranylgeranyl reductase family protein [Candidatus Lokiarchaeota archaeon]MBD3201582.1 geranylgeranyl reductase family protein [Candidatus Lokiarchaeota archaeon]